RPLPPLPPARPSRRPPAPRFPRPTTPCRATRKGTADASRLSRRAVRPAVLHRPVRGPRPPQRDPGPDVGGADAQRGQPEPGRVRRVAQPGGRGDPALRSGAHPVHHRHRRGRDRHRAGDRPRGPPQPRHRGHRQAPRHRRGPRPRRTRRPARRRRRTRQRRPRGPGHRPRRRERRGHRVTTTPLAVLVPLLPFLGVIAGLLLGRTALGFVRPLAVLPTLTSLVLAATVAARQGGGRAVDAATELTPTGSVPVELALHIDGFAALTAVLVGAVATCVQVYSTGYLRNDPRYPSYAALVSLFT